MKKFKLLSLLLIIILLAGVLPVSALAMEIPVSAAQYVVLMDADTGDMLYEKQPDAPFLPDVMSTLALAAVLGDSLDRQDVRLNDVVTISESINYNILEGASVAGLVPGETLTVEQLLFSAVLTSAQDSANALAEYAFGSFDGCVAAMNDKAAELGCTNTHFVNANGVGVDGQYTTARDLALIARAAIKNPQVMTAFQSSSYTIPATEFSAERLLSCPNALINEADERNYELAYAGKTATISLGTCLVAAATYNDIDVIAVIIGCPDGTDRFVEARNLFDWVFANFSYRTLVSSADVLGTIPVSMGSPDSVDVRASDSIRMLLPNDQDPGEVTTDIVYAYEQEGTELQAPIAVGEYLGDLTVSAGGQVRGASRVVAATAVDISRLNYLRSQLDVLLQNQSVRKIITILLMALGVYLLLVVVYTIQRVVHLHSLRQARRARARTRAQQELGWLELPREEDGGYLPRSEPSGPVDFREEPSEEGEPEDAEQDADGGYFPAEGGAAPEDEPPARSERADADEEGDGYYEDDGEYYEDEGENAEYFDEDDGGSHGKSGRRWRKRR